MSYRRFDSKSRRCPYFCLQLKAEDLGITWVVVLGFFVWSLHYQLSPPCYPFIFPFLTPYLPLSLSLTPLCGISVDWSDLDTNHDSITDNILLNRDDLSRPVSRVTVIITVEKEERESSCFLSYSCSSSWSPVCSACPVQRRRSAWIWWQQQPHKIPQQPMHRLKLLIQLEYEL